jgi:hypothetical protein
MSANSASTAPLERPVMRQVLRIEFPSTKAAMICLRFSVLKRFITLCICLSGNAMSMKFFAFCEVLWYYPSSHKPNIKIIDYLRSLRIYLVPLRELRIYVSRPATSHDAKRLS